MTRWTPGFAECVESCDAGELEGGSRAATLPLMNKLLRACFAVVLGCAFLALGGCLLGPNIVLEGPDGVMAVVLEDDGSYQPLPEGGSLWLLDENGTPLRVLMTLGEERDARPADWDPQGEALLALVTEEGEFGFPEGWKLMLVPLEGEPVELVASEEPIFSARYGLAGDILYSRSRDETVALLSLDPASGEETVLAEDVLAFMGWEQGFYVLGADGILRSADGAELPLQMQCPEDGCDEFLQLWPHVYLDVSPSGRYVAIALEQEPRLVFPEVSAEATLYLVDLEEERATYLAAPAMIPSFSPDGTALAFIGEPPGGPEAVYIYHLAEGRSEALNDSAYAWWVRWVPSGLLIAVEVAWGYELRRWADDTWTVFDLSIP